MARDLEFDAELQPLLRASERYASVMGVGFVTAFRRGLAGMVRRAAAVTPPASRSSSSRNSGESVSRAALTKDDQDRGMTAIQKDFMAIFTGLGTSGSRRQRATSLVEATAIHDRLFAKKVPGRRMRSDRPGGDRYVIPEDVLAALRRIYEKRVGFTAAGWKAGASKTGVRLPAWVNNKEGRGSASVQFSGTRLGAVITNAAVPPKLEGEVMRRLRAGVRYQVRSMEREMIAYAKKTGRSSGLSSN